MVEQWEENELKKEYLKSYKRAKMREKRILDEIQRLRADQMFPSVTYSDMPHGTNISDLSDYIVRLEAEIDRLRQERLEKIKIYKGIEDRIRKMKNENEQELLRLRYITDLSWEEVAAEMGFTSRHITRLHGKALTNFQLSFNVHPTM